ncbi:tRNA (adenosine(37)-N6)-dimethylallyltransferase MiaA [Cucumibacter marinus]|uniref:tRNA (adenosine(37)-N6)-dimethylallyltransferase MiaA n=1 Tax=Cucumibacter marinus TaxID=1121252 RepID=UPI001FE0D92A|nr:tRNA (adenosine(37)-N6)-dimethylallyltransferase MiaA [Cucumibacter marinus]
MVLIAGPTASGKTGLAIERAQRSGGVIVNSDSMQVYDVLRVLTARPDAAEMAAAPHHLFGFVPPSQRFSTGAWLAAVREKLAGKLSDAPEIIFAGGTGLYFEALTQGLAEVPPVDPAIVRKVEATIAGLDADDRARLMAARDPAMAERLEVPDTQRVVRALSVLEATGRSLAAFLDAPQTPIVDPASAERIVLAPDRTRLRARIRQRFEAMMEGEAIEEVRALNALGLDQSLPAMKAIGVPEITAMLAGDRTREEVIEKASIATGQYAKRQETWFRNRMADWRRIDPLE